MIYGQPISFGAKPKLQTKTVTPSASSQSVTPDSGYDGLSKVTVSGDSDLKAANIASGANIFGVSGSYTGEPVLLWTNASPTSTFSGQTVSVSGSAYNTYLVEVALSSSSTDNKSIGLIHKQTAAQWLVGGGAAASASAVPKRKVTKATNTGVTFGDGYSGSNNTASTSGIPTRIWGVKWTIS